MKEYFTMPMNLDSPTFWTVGYTMLFTFFLSTMIAFTYDKTTPSSKKKEMIIHGLILSSIVAATVMQAIGDSLARGLGMLGALAIIRFRTNLKDPRDIVFMFAALASGIACGVYGFFVGLGGSLSFCMIAFMLRFSNFYNPHSLKGTLRFSTDRDHHGHDEVKKLIRSYCRNINLCSVQLSTPKEKDSNVEFEYQMELKKPRSQKELMDAIGSLNDISGFRLKNLAFNENLEI